MDARELIALLEINGTQADELTQRLIEQLKERGAILDDLEALQVRHIERQHASAALIVEAAMLLGELDGTRTRRTLLGRLFAGAVH